MARITEEMKVQINELYYVIRVKAEVARQLGISAASVTRYLIPNYVPIAKRTTISCDVDPAVPINFIDAIKNADDRAAVFAELTKLTATEVESLNDLRKEIYI